MEGHEHLSEWHTMDGAGRTRGVLRPVLEPDSRAVDMIYVLCLGSIIPLKIMMIMMAIANSRIKVDGSP
jgi:hypothetical protein